MSDNKKGRPKTKPIEIPKFESDEELRNYLLETVVEIIVHLKKEALKGRETKSAQIIRAKTQQLKTVIDAVKVTNQILKDKQLDYFANQLELLTLTNNFTNIGQDNNEFELSNEVLKELERIEGNMNFVNDYGESHGQWK